MLAAPLADDEADTDGADTPFYVGAQDAGPASNEDPASPSGDHTF